MGEPETSEEPAESTGEAATQRLAFDKDFEKEVPQFLKKGKAKKTEPEEEENDPDSLEPETTDPISTDNPTENEEMDQLVGTKQPKPAKDINFANLTAEMTIEQLKKQQEEIDRRIKEKQSAEKQTVIDQIVNVVGQYGIPIDELVDALGGMKARRKGTKAKAKYRDPATGTTWSGRGKEPHWIKGAADRTPFEI